MTSYKDGISASILDPCKNMSLSSTGRVCHEHDLASDQLERLWICEKHRHETGKNWRPRPTYQYPLHSGRKKELKTRNAVNLVMSREINAIYGKHVPMGSRKSGEL